MKHLLLAPFLLGFISPIYAEDVEKKWLESSGSTSEWLETKNWDNDYWWRLYLPLYLEVKQDKTNPVVIHSVFDKEIIDSHKFRSCWEFIELNDMPKEVEKSCISLHQKEFYKSKNDKDFFYKNFPPAYIAFIEGKKWNHLDTLRTQGIKNIKNSMSKASADKEIKNINDIAADQRGFFNDSYISQFNSAQTPEKSRKAICANRYIKKELEKNREPRKIIYPSLSVFAYCYEVAMNHDKELKEYWEIYKQRVYDLGKCIEAKDFIGCAKHNKMDWLIE